MFSKTRTFFGVAGLVTALSLPLGLAQAALEEIVVTAERREGNLQEVPIAVSAISMEQMEKLQIREGQDLQRYVPSLNMFSNVTSPTNLSPSLRGGLQQDSILITAESPFGIFMDDIYVGRLNGNNVTMTDIEQIEVLRGPQGTLFGRNTAYGAIKLVTRTPGEEAWFNATVGVGNYDQLRFEASVGGPLGSSWAGSLTGQYLEKDGQYTNIFEPTPGNPVGDVDSQENTAFRGKLRYMGGDIFDAVLSVSYSKAENDALQQPNFTTPNRFTDCRVDPCSGADNATYTTEDIDYTNGDFTVNTPVGPLTTFGASGVVPLGLPLFGDKTAGETEQTIVALNLTWDFSNGMTLRSITGYVGITDYMHTDFNGNYALPPGFGVMGATDVDTDQFTQEFQLLGTAFDDRLSYLVGAFYLTEDGTQPFNWALAIAPGGISAGLSASLIDSEAESWSVFGDATYRFTDNLSGSLGVRYTDDSKDFVYDFTALAFPPTGPQNCAGSLDPNRCVLSSDTDDWTPRAVLEYTFGDSGVMAYGSYAEGFKGGGFSAIAIFSTDPIAVYGPETNTTYEAGLKATWLGDRLRTNLAYFFSDIEDVQQNSTDATNPNILEFPVQNSGDAEIQGFEFEITWVPIDGLNLFTSGSLMDGEYTRLETDSSAFASKAIYYGDPNAEPQTPQTPDYSVNVGFDYTFDFPTDVLGDFSFGFDYYEIDNYVTAATNDFHNSGWDQWNGFIALGIAENWQLQFTGKNLGDEANHTSGSRGLGGGIYLPPREFLFTVTYQM
jgi:iron complex outermembrane receptor protein